MEQQKKHDIALMKYSAIAPVISGLPAQYKSFSEYFREVSEKGILHPDGSLRHYATSTIAKWYELYVKNGFDSLQPSSRSDEGKPRRLDHALQEQVIYLKEHYPRMSAAAIYRQLLLDGSIRRGELSESTVLRFINRLSMEKKMTPGQDMRRYERPHINEVWCGDSSAGPYLKTPDGKRRRVYVIALIDDASRMVVGINVFFNDTFVNLMSVLKSAVSKYGVPKVLNFDNGSAYKNRQMELLAARIGSVINYCRPYTPTAKAKIERWFRTMKDQWMASLDMRDFHSLDALRGSLSDFVRSYNLAPHSSLKGKSPQDRFFSEPGKIRRLDMQQIEERFLLELERRVSADSVIVIDGVEYEVDCRFAKQRVTLRYSPDMKDIFVLEHDGSLAPIRLLNKHENASVKREKIHLCGGGD